MALPVSNTLEGGTNGTTVSAANSGGASGTALDDIGTVTAGTLAYDNTIPTLPLHGLMVLKVATGATSGNSYAGWLPATTGTGNSGVFSGRFYFRAGTLVTFTSSRIFAAYTGTGTTVCFTFILTRATMIINVNDTSGANIGSAGSALAANTWYRFEFQCTPSTTAGQVLARIYQGDSSTIFTSITTAATVNLGGAGFTGGAEYGNSGTGAASVGPYYYDDLAIVAGASWIGPSVPALPPPMLVAPGQGQHMALTRASTY